MTWLDKSFSLPTLGGDKTDGAGSAAQSTSTNATDWSFAGAKKAIGETYDKLTASFSKNPFSKPTQEGASFAALGAAGTTGAAVKSNYSLVAGGEASRTRLGASTSGVSASGVRAEVGDAAKPQNTFHKVKLVSKYKDSSATKIVDDEYGEQFVFGGAVEVVFDIMPEVSEQRSVEYEALAPPQLPGEFQKYKGTKSTQWTITGTFAASTREQAAKNYLYMNTLRGWTMPFFGDKQIARSEGKLGAPPPVLDFSGWRGLVGTVPVVITSLSWNWPKEVDWLPTGILDEVNGEEIPFPAVMQVTINVTESFSAEQFNAFDIVEFRNGRMISAFGGTIPRVPQTSVAEPKGGNQGIANGTAQPQSNFWGSDVKLNKPTTASFGNAANAAQAQTSKKSAWELPSASEVLPKIMSAFKK